MPSDLAVENALLRDALAKVVLANDQGKRYARGHPAFLRARVIMERPASDATDWLRAYDALHEVVALVAWSDAPSGDLGDLARATLEYIRYMRAGNNATASAVDRVRQELIRMIRQPVAPEGHPESDCDGMVELRPSDPGYASYMNHNR